ncbi:MAG: thioredoxin family protein [Pseudomonadota bacterium]
MLDRRSFILATAATALVAPASAEAQTLDYTPGLVDQRLAAGETVFLDFAADWCSTCRRQERVIDELRAANPAYNSAITFVRVDWDQYGSGDLSRRLAVPRRSTLIVLRGDQELGRIVAGTSRSDIEALLNAGLA